MQQVGSVYMSAVLRETCTCSVSDRFHPQAEAGMQNDKLRWLQNQVLYQELQDLLMDHQLTEAQNKELQPAAKQVHKIHVYH